MHLSNVICALLAVAGVVAADDSFRLKVDVLSGQDHQEFQGQYVTGIRIGAGFYTAGIAPKSLALVGHITDKKQVLFHYDGNAKDNLGMIMSPGQDYNEAWSRVDLDDTRVHNPSTGLAFDKDNHLTWHNNGVFGGWRVCHWNHKHGPQLFWDNTQALAPPVTCNCAKVNLVKEKA